MISSANYDSNGLTSTARAWRLLANLLAVNRCPPPPPPNWFAAQNLHRLRIPLFRSPPLLSSLYRPPNSQVVRRANPALHVVKKILLFAAILPDPGTRDCLNGSLPSRRCCCREYEVSPRPARSSWPRN